jgi:hypothetical protein
MSRLESSKTRRSAIGCAVLALTLVLGACSSSSGKSSSPTSPTTNGKPSSSATPASNASALTGNTPCEKSGPPASEGQVLDGEGHFHRGPTAQVPLTESARQQLEAEQAQARAVALKYPTVADAVAAGYRESTVYVPCIGAHYTNTSLVASFNPATPSELLYDGTRPNSKIVGLSYLVFHPGGAPTGFAGANDRWHQHNLNGGLCMKGGLVIGAESTSKSACEQEGGQKIALDDIWMVHDWIVAGWECSWGVFAAECPELGGKTGLDAFHT